MIDPNRVPIVSFNERNTIRLISTAHIDEPALAPLTDNDNELSFLESIEGLTSARHNTGVPLPMGVDAKELLSEHNGYGWTYVNAAFCYTRSSGNRFNSPDRGAWYASWGTDAAKTAQAEVAWHMTRELQATGGFNEIISYRELIASFISDMHDLRELQAEVELSSDPEQAYPAGQQLASSLRHISSQGVIYPSARYNGGQCLAAFRPHIVQNIRQGKTYIFEWQGEPDPIITLKP